MILILFDMDDLEPIAVVGPFETEDEADAAWDTLRPILEDTTRPGHIRPHTLGGFIESVHTVQDIIERYTK